MPPCLASVFLAKGVATKMLNNAHNIARERDDPSLYGPSLKPHLAISSPDKTSDFSFPAKVSDAEILSLPPDKFFVAGKENRLVINTFSKVLAAEGIPKLQQLSPLVLVGPSGCGKSLISNAIYDKCSAQFDEDDTLLITAADFRRRLDLSVREEQIELFRERFRDLKLLVVEDLHRLPANDLLQEEIMRTFASIQKQGGIVVTTLAKPAGHITAISRRLLSWLSSGLSLEISSPAVDTRLELIHQYLLKTGAPASIDALKILTHTLTGDVRQIEKAALQIRKRFGKRNSLTMGQAQAYLADIPRTDTPPLRLIASVVAKYYTLTLRDLRSTSRKQTIVLARAITSYLARELTPLSYEDIGRYLGGRDHTTIMHNSNRIKDRLPGDRALRSALDELRLKIKGACQAN